jgi:phosphoserine phosphatase
MILDLLIIDIDDAFIYHRTVALANRLFLEEISGKRLDRFYTAKKTLVLAPFLLRKINKRVLLLLRTAIKLYYLNFTRKINNRFFKIKSCEQMIKIWADTILRLQINQERYQLSEEMIKGHINKKLLKKYKNIKSKKIIAITEHFSVGKDPIKKILNIDNIISNKFITKQGIITGYEINVKNKEDKLDIAKKYKAKSIGLIIEDYDDIKLLSLKNIKLVISKKRLKKWINSNNTINKFFLFF